MRRLGKRPKIDTKTAKRLLRATNKIKRNGLPKEEARRIYEAARSAAWFKVVISLLTRMSGSGARCMYCSGSEASQVEHFRPKALFPELAMTWHNFLWACSICNHKKGDHFPPDTGPGGMIINPIETDPWEFFFIDEFGALDENL